MDNIFITDDDRQSSSNEQRSSSNEQSSSDTISSVATENLLPVYETDQQQIPSINNIRVRPIKVNNCSSLPNLQIRHPYRPDDNENDPFNDEKKIIIDKHVNVSRITRSSLRSLNADILNLKLDESLRRKSTGNVRVSRASKRTSQSINGNLNNQEITQMTPRQSTVRVNRIPTAASISQGCDQKIIASKPVVTKVSHSNKLPFKMKHEELYVSVKHISKRSKKRS